MSRRVPVPALLLIPAVLAGTAGCRSFSTFSIESRPAVPEVVVNGSSDDWTGRTYSIGDGEVSLGFMNDGKFLYLCLRTGDRDIGRRIMSGGLTVWIDPKGGRKKASGIRYPLPEDPRPDEAGIQLAEPPVDEEGEETDRPERGAGPGRGPEPGRKDIEIVASEKGSPERLGLDKSGGIEAAIGPAENYFVYEMKIPLARSAEHPFGIGAAPGDIVGIGFETGKSERNRGRGGRPGGEEGGGPGGTGMPPMGGGMRGGMGPRGGGMMGRGGSPGLEPDLPKGLKLWAFVRLSAAESGGQAEMLSYQD